MTGTLAHFVALLRADFVSFAQQRLNEIGISRGILYFLIYISKHEGCGAGELSAGLHADAGYATRAVNKLVSGGFAQRRHDGADKRTVALYLTQKGRMAFEQARALFAAWDDKMLSHLDDGQRRTLLLGMEQLSQYTRGTEHV